MNNLTLTFPAMPDGADKSITQPSNQFKKSTYKVIAAIALFVVVYILLLISATAIAAALGWLGVAMMTAVGNFIVLVLGIGLILCGLMLIFFLVKFIFTKSQKKIPGYEITENEQPELFAFIRKVTDEVGTSYPKHVYLTNDVNAMASFNPTFWSLFLPIRKDLTIGLGLVNALNQSEFKAVLAHEFGHFSQRSMRFGSYVYHLNKALYNLLYENAGYNKALNAWGRWHWMLRFAATINIYIIRCIQEILRKVYLFINKSYMQLSRQMEFHADAIATYASGGNNIISSLRRLEIAQQCYDQVFPIINTKLSENLRSVNIYELQSWLLKQYANANRLDIDKNGIPVIDKTVILNNSQITIDNQWASHPEIEDREENVNQFNLNSAVVHESAWQLFRNADELQKHFTDELYQNVSKKDELTIVDLKVIEESLEKEKVASSHNQLYKGFYDGRLLTTFKVEEVLAENVDKDLNNFNELFSDENCNLPKLIDTINIDIIKLESLIESKSDDIKSFDFRGVKYYPKDAANIKEQLSAELKEKEERLKKLDKNIFRMFCKAATDEQKQKLVDHYDKVFKYQTDATIDYGNYNMMMNALRPVYTQMSYSNIYHVVNKIYDLEKDVKPRMTEVLKESNIKPFINEAQRSVLDNYLNNKWVYFLEPKYDNNALTALNNGFNTFLDVLVRRNFKFKNDLFDFQLKLIN
jgi:Zn-dependent protease with chaperone function